MIALFGNISGLEVGIIVLLAVLIFGSRLPEVAGRAYTQFRRLRESIDRFRRDTGIDKEMREIQRSVRDAAWRDQLQASLKAPERAAVEREISMPPQNVPKKHSSQPASSATEALTSEQEASRTKEVGQVSKPLESEDSAEGSPGPEAS